MGIHQHTDRYEENGTEEVFYRRYYLLYLLCLDRLGKYATHHECSEGRAEARLGREHRHKTAHTEGHDKQHLVIHKRSHAAQEGRDKEQSYHKPYNDDETDVENHLQHHAAIRRPATGKSSQHHHHDDGENVLQYQHTHDEAGKLLLLQTHIVECLIDNGGGRHGKHAGKEHTVHLRPTEETRDENTYHHHREDNGEGGDNRSHAHLQDFLERKVQTQCEEKEHNADVAPYLDILVIYDRYREREVWRYNESCHDISKHKRLLEFLEYQRHNTRCDENQGKIPYYGRNVFHYA